MWITSRLVNTRFPSFLKHQQNCKRLLIWALVIHVWKALHFQESHSCLHYRENYYLCYHLCYVIHVGLIVKMFWFRRGLYRFFLKKSFLQKKDLCFHFAPDQFCINVKSFIKYHMVALLYPNQHTHTPWSKYVGFSWQLFITALLMLIHFNIMLSSDALCYKCNKLYTVKKKKTPKC